MDTSSNPALAKSAERIEELWATRWADHVRITVEIGRELLRQKEALGHGNLLVWVEAKLEFSVSNAERFMKIAENAVLANSANSPNLPPSWTTLHELTRLPEEQLKQYLADGTITPDTSGKDVAALLPKKEKKDHKPPVPSLEARRKKAEKLLGALHAAAVAFAKVELDLQVPEYTERDGWKDQLGDVLQIAERQRDRLEELGAQQEEVAPPRSAAFMLDTMPAPAQEAAP